MRLFTGYSLQRLHGVLCGALMVAVAGALVSSLAHASDGHNHGEMARTVSVAPRAEMRIGTQEAVITYTGGSLVLFLHRYIDGTPTKAAEIEITVDFMPSTLSEIADGVYRSEPLTLAGGRNEIEMSYVIGDQQGTETIPIVVPTNAKSPPRPGLAPAVNKGIPASVLAALAGVLFLGVNFILIRRARREKAVPVGG